MQAAQCIGSANSDKKFHMPDQPNRLSQGFSFAFLLVLGIGGEESSRGEKVDFSHCGKSIQNNFFYL